MAEEILDRQPTLEGAITLARMAGRLPDPVLQMVLPRLTHVPGEEWPNLLTYCPDLHRTGGLHSCAGWPCCRRS